MQKDNTDGWIIQGIDWKFLRGSAQAIILYDRHIQTNLNKYKGHMKSTIENFQAPKTMFFGAVLGNINLFFHRYVKYESSKWDSFLSLKILLCV